MPTLHPLLPNAPMLADPSILSPPLTHVRRSPIPPSSRPKPPAPPGPPPPGRASAKRPSWNIPANLFRMDSNSNETAEDADTREEDESFRDAMAEEIPSAASPVVAADDVLSTGEGGAASPNAENDVRSPKLERMAMEEDGATNSKITRVDGKGLWRSWKRNFNSQFTAILDLIDNSLDASIEGIDQGFIGRCHIRPDTYTYREENWTLEKTTGIAIINNCIKTMRPLQKCLEIYDSSKVDSGADHVGENGVGLKQACATLSDRSFVLMKNGSDANCELGIIAEQLQRNEGAYLPAFRFSNDSYDAEMPSLERQMMDCFSQPNNADVAQCIAQYGSGLNGNGPSLDFGIRRLCDHFDMICRDFYDHPHVFAVIVDNVRNDNVEERTGVANDSLTKIQVNKLLAELREKIPLTYLHVPNSFEFLVHNHRIVFEYWQKRMVEFTRFTINVGTTLRFDDPRDDPQKCAIRLFIGFDTWALNDNFSKKCGALFLYSRQSGRLIVHHPDARTILELSAGGTEYCSGLRIIIDDFEGHLPLNPTKQDIAFSEKACGDILKENLYKSVGAVVRMYYKFHIGKYSNKKTVLTKMIKEYLPEMKRSGDSLHTELCKLELSTFKLSNTSIYSTSVGSKILRLNGKEIIGKDTLFRLLPEKLPAPPRPEPPRPTTSDPTIRNQVSTSDPSRQNFEPDSKKRKLASVNATWTCRKCNSPNHASSTWCAVCKTSALGSASLAAGTNYPYPSQVVSALNPQAPINLNKFTDNDVICGQAGMIDPTNNHPGNERFWKYFRKFEHRFVNATTPQDQIMVAIALLNELKYSCPSTRFFVKPAAQFAKSGQATSIVLKALRIYSKPAPRASQPSADAARSPIMSRSPYSDSPSQPSYHASGNGLQSQVPCASRSPQPSTNFAPSPRDNEGFHSPDFDHASQPNNPACKIAEDSNGSECYGHLSQGEEHYKRLCEGLVKKAEELQAKAERRKHKYNEVVQKNALLERENLELKKKIESLEKKLEASDSVG